MRLDFRHKEKGTRIFPDEIDEALEKIGYELKERDIVLIHTGAGAYNTEERYKTDFPGMTAEATRHLIAQGRADDGLRRDHVRSAGVGDVRAEALLGGAPA